MKWDLKYAIMAHKSGAKLGGGGGGDPGGLDSCPIFLETG